MIRVFGFVKSALNLVAGAAVMVVSQRVAEKAIDSGKEKFDKWREDRKTKARLEKLAREKGGEIVEGDWTDAA